jgi:hypothetical protein
MKFCIWWIGKLTERNHLTSFLKQNPSIFLGNLRRKKINRLHISGVGIGNLNRILNDIEQDCGFVQAPMVLQYTWNGDTKSTEMII